MHINICVVCLRIQFVLLCDTCKTGLSCMSTQDWEKLTKHGEKLGIISQLLGIKDGIFQSKKYPTPEKSKKNAELFHYWNIFENWSNILPVIKNFKTSTLANCRREIPTWNTRVCSLLNIMKKNAYCTKLRSRISISEFWWRTMLYLPCTCELK